MVVISFLETKQNEAPVTCASLAPETASEMLYRRVPPEEISDRSKEWSFWSVIRRRLFETMEEARAEEKETEEGGALGDDVSEEEEEEEEEGQETAKPNVVLVVKYQNKKGIITQNKSKRQEQHTQIMVHNWSEETRMVRASVGKWCARRYEMEEENMLKVLEARGATAGNPIQRLTLRNEARKLIGDTGLLDNLLMHMAGKLAPGGADRFQRRHNADGAMEYWLESPDLVEIRKEAGVQDPYWIPPQGWKPGDDPSQDPICATMFKELWDEIAKMKKREKESKQPEQGLAMVPTTSNSLVTSVTSMNWDQAYTSVMQLKDKYTQLAVRKSKFEEQMQQASQTLSGMKEEIMALKSTMQAPEAALRYYSEAADVPQLTDNERRADENKETKLQRLRSGFRICRPQGTVLWPNMNFSMSQHQIDPSALPTTPCVTSSTKPATQLDLVLTDQSPQAPSPGSSSGSLAKPFAERRAVNTSTLLCNVTPSPAFTRVPSETEKITSLSHSLKTLQINLNEIPADAKHSECTAISRTISYQRRHQLGEAPVMGYDDMGGLKGTTAVARIGCGRIDVATDMRGSDRDYVVDDLLQKICIDEGILCTGVGRTTICQEFIAIAFAATKAVFRDVAHGAGAGIYVAAGVLLTCLDNYESTHGVVCTEVFLICGFSGGHPHIFRVSSTSQGGISCRSEVGFTLVIGSGSLAGQEFVLQHEHDLQHQDLVEGTIVYASLRDPHTGGHVHSVQIPLQGVVTYNIVSVLQLLRRDFHLYAQWLQMSLFFICPSFHYTQPDEPVLLENLRNHYPLSRVHIISRQATVIRILNFENLMDCIVAWDEVRNGADWYFGQQQHTLLFYEATVESMAILALLE